MRRLALAIATAALMALSLAPAASARSTSFAGVWTAIDVDGSVQMLMVSGGSAPTVTYLDSFASTCAGGASTHFAANGRGTLVVEEDGTVDGLFVQFTSAGCGNDRLVGGFPAFYFFVGSLLTDNFGNNWQLMH